MDDQKLKAQAVFHGTSGKLRLHRSGQNSRWGDPIRISVRRYATLSTTALEQQFSLILNLSLSLSLSLGARIPYYCFPFSSLANRLPTNSFLSLTRRK